MFKCNRTNTPVVLSSVEGYTFYNPVLDEDLYSFEVYLDVSDAAKAEAIELAKLPNVPANFSHNTALVQAVQSNANIQTLLEVLGSNRELEYCEAVLMYYATQLKS